MKRFILPVLLLSTVLPAGVSAVAAEVIISGEPTIADCHEALEKGRIKANELSPQSLSRYTAERLLHAAETEAGNGEFDGCVEFAEKAIGEIDNRWSRLAPGETFRATTSPSGGVIELRGDER